MKSQILYKINLVDVSGAYLPFITVKTGQFGSRLTLAGHGEHILKYSQPLLRFEKQQPPAILYPQERRNFLLIGRLSTNCSAIKAEWARSEVRRQSLTGTLKKPPCFQISVHLQGTLEKLISVLLYLDANTVQSMNALPITCLVCQLHIFPT
ncbi:hypothetical protein L1887_08927 [Cichorium endivia]|nr:hypothetical protein L1887_08927 [Cichorium endivia]